jgi:hypothetical protein
VGRAALLGAVLLLAGCGGAKDDPGRDAAPRFTGRPPVVRLDLPARMRDAMERAGPGFQDFAVADFDTFIWKSQPGWSYDFDGLQAPFAVIGDFDGDGRRDAVVRQRSDTEDRTILVLDQAAGPTTTELYRAPSGPAARATPEWIYLVHVEPGAHVAMDTTVVLEHEGFEIGYLEKAAEMFYFTGGRLSSVATTD